MTRTGFHTITLGCKLNQFDSAALEGELVRRGWLPEADATRAAVVIVNTCTVTARADADARKLIRRVRRGNPECRLLVTGCWAELDPEAVARVGGVDHVFGNRDKRDLPGLLDALGIAGTGASPDVHGTASLGSGAAPRGDRGCDATLDLPDAVHFGERSRAFLKVQEGCDLACSYCVIPRVRGASRSVPPGRVEAALLSLVRAGYREIVLTGVNTGDYGRDLTPRTSLAVLLRRLLDRCAPARLRLNSLEPLTVTDEIVELFAGHPRLAPHLQVPLQSGCEAILRRMRRNYRLSTYLDRLGALRRAAPDACIGADVIVGFPGETDARFDETRAFIEASPLDYLHVFSWSARPGTDAGSLDGRVHAAVVRRRSARLRELGARKFLRFRERFVGRRLDAVALGPRTRDGKTRALTGNFVEVVLDREIAPGRRVEVRVDRADAAETLATVTGGPG